MLHVWSKLSASCILCLLKALYCAGICSYAARMIKLCWHNFPRPKRGGRGRGILHICMRSCPIILHQPLPLLHVASHKSFMRSGKWLCTTEWRMRLYKVEACSCTVFTQCMWQEQINTLANTKYPAAICVLPYMYLNKRDHVPIQMGWSQITGSSWITAEINILTCIRYITIPIGFYNFMLKL